MFLVLLKVVRILRMCEPRIMKGNNSLGRVTFIILPSIYDGALHENSQRPQQVDYICIKDPTKWPPIAMLYFFFFWGPEATLFSNI